MKDFSLFLSKFYNFKSCFCLNHYISSEHCMAHTLPQSLNNTKRKKSKAKKKAMKEAQRLGCKFDYPNEKKFDNAWKYWTQVVRRKQRKLNGSGFGNLQGNELEKAKLDPTLGEEVLLEMILPGKRKDYMVSRF